MSEILQALDKLVIYALNSPVRTLERQIEIYELKKIIEKGLKGK